MFWSCARGNLTKGTAKPRKETFQSSKSQTSILDILSAFLMQSVFPLRSLKLFEIIPKIGLDTSLHSERHIGDVQNLWSDKQKWRS